MKQKMAEFMPAILNIKEVTTSQLTVRHNSSWSVTSTKSGQLRNRASRIKILIVADIDYVLA
jgi:hypothetical protein